MNTRRLNSMQPLMLALLLAVTGAITGGTNYAQAAEQRYAYDIPAGQLDATLARIAREAGQTISIAPEMVKGKTAAPVQGELTLEQAFAQALAGSGLALSVGENGALGLKRVPDEGQETTLSTVNVNAATDKETALGPVYGYVAKRSITATKADIPLIETPQSVSIVTADQIAIQNAESLAQAFKYTPGITSMGGDNTTSDGMVIRGFNVTGSAPMYLNGTKLSRNTFSGVAEPYAIERIELLKGPASVLYGNAAPGGIINMVSKLPQTETQRQLKVQAGSFDRKQLAGDFTGALTEDGEFSYRITGLSRRSDTMVDHIQDDRDFLAGSLKWQPTEQTSLVVLANYQHNDTKYNYGLPAEGTVLDNINGDIDRDLFIGEPGFNKFDTKNHTLGYLFSHEINDHLTFRQNLLYFDAETDYKDISIGSLDASQRLLSRGAYTREDENSSWTIDNQLEMKWQLGNTEHTTLLGLDRTESEFERLQHSGSVAPLDLFAPQYGAAVTLNALPTTHFGEETEQMGLYGQEHVKIANRWVVMLGGRYDKVESRSRNYISNQSATTFDDDAFTGRAGLVYLFDNGFAPYVSYAESFEPASGQDASGKAFEPTEGEQYEVGLRYQPAGQALSVTASVYKLTQTNVSTRDLANPGFSIQEGEVESKGFELEARANLVNNLNLIASYTYIDNAVTKSNTGTEGNRFAGVARHTASLWADYRFSKVGVGAGVRYHGKSFNLANTYEVPGYTVVDAVVNYTLSPEWLLSLNVNNVFDKEYATCTYACFYGVKRSALATATYNW